MLRFAVVDDQKEDLEYMKQCIEYLAETIGEEINATYYSDPKLFLASYKGDLDIILMDIEMPEINGIEIVRQIRKSDKLIPVLFVTNMAQFVFQGYEVNAIDYIVKPIDKYGFALKMKRAIARCEGLNKEAIVVNIDGVIRKIETRLIRYFEVQGHYVIIHMADDNLKVYSTLKNIEKQLSSGLFARSHRYYLVNLRYVDEIKKDKVLVDGDELVISRPQKKEFIRAFTEFIGRGVGNV